MEKEFNYPLFYRKDLTAFWALFADNLTNIVILSGNCLAVFNMPAQIVFGRILPGLGVSLLAGLSFYVYLARRLARKEQRTDVTALPYGISTPVMFVYLFGIIGPVYWGLKASGNADASIIAWQVGMAAAFIGGIIEMLGSTAAFSGTASFLTLIGIIHSPSMGLHFTHVFWGYIMMTALFIAAWLGKVERDPEIGELDFEADQEENS